MELNCVLLIDDDKICNYLHEKIIQRLNITPQVKIANNGAEALLTIKKHIIEFNEPPQLIFLDLKMPVMDGFEFLKKFKEEDPRACANTDIIILTTSTHPKDLEKISKIRKTNFYNKPLTEQNMPEIFNTLKKKKKVFIEENTD
jgi:CheY-like chemotaxis protein